MSEIPFDIRVASGKDVPGVLALWSTMMVEHEKFDARIKMADGAEAAYQSYLGYHLSNKEARLSVAAAPAGSDGKVVGFALAVINRNLPMFLPPRYGYLSDLVVAKSVRRQGIGRALVQDISAWLKEQGVGTVQLQVYSENRTAVDFWRSLGFANFYERMWLDLSQAPEREG